MSPVDSDRRLRILLIDDHIPYPALGVGYPRARDMLHALVALGHGVTLAPLHDTGATPAAAPGVVPDAVEIEHGVTPASLGRFLHERAGRFDLLLVSRPGNLRSVLSARPPSWLGVPLLYDAEAIWAKRTVLQRAVEGTPLSTQEAERLLQEEIDLARAASHVMAVNEAEAAIFRAGACASVNVVGHGFTPQPTPGQWADRRDILFVGALDDTPSPNVDALSWFVREVMPLLQTERSPPVRLLVAGRNAAPGVRALAGPHVLLLGQIHDLGDLYDRARIFVAPHRYAAGIPTKVLETAARGVPCVCSELIAAQLGWTNEREVLVASSARDFAHALHRLDSDPVLWGKVRGQALGAIARNFDRARFDAGLAAALDQAMRAAPMVVALAGQEHPGVARSIAVRIGRDWRRVATALPRRLLNEVHAWRISRCPLFDRHWYLRMYEDVAASGADPAMHYLLHGAAEGRDPGPAFSTMGYLSRHADVAGSGRNPLLHFMRDGLALGYASGPRAHGAQGRHHRHHVVLICGEPGTAGVALRVTNLARAMVANGATTAVMTIPEAVRQLQRVAQASVLVLWRTAWDEHVAAIVKQARQAGACVLFDADDLVIEPSLARVEVIDGIRTQNLDADEVRSYFERTLKAFEAADWASCSTDVLAAHMRVRGKPTFVLPNGFSDDVHWRSRRAFRRRQALSNDDLVRLGYAAGTHTHQRDFALMASALADVLRQRPQCRLVLFKRPDGEPLLDIAEFRCFDDLQSQIEWRGFVSQDLLAEELVRFDINLAPVETGNPFCESKSELKFVDAALVGVCTVASPTVPFASAIQPGRSGFLAEGGEQWQSILMHLVDDPALRRRVADAAYRQVLWLNGPRHRAERVAAVLDQMLAPAATAARTKAWLLRRPVVPPALAMPLPEARVLFLADRLGQADVTVIVPLHNYAQFVGEALDSVAAQTLGELDLIVVDDASTDDSLAVAEDWVRRHAARFNRVLLLKHAENAGLGPARNSAIERAETPFVLPLDADDRLLPSACERLLRLLRQGQADFAYPLIQCFGEDGSIIGKNAYSAQSLVGGNCIAAIALIRKECWAAVGGYAAIDQGWEDFDFWCKFVEMGLWGEQVPEVLAEYRIHAASMTRRHTRLAQVQQSLQAVMQQRHPWLSLPMRFGVTVPDPDLGTQT